MAYEINCDDGVTLTGATIDEVLDKGEQHIRESHPDQVDSVGREQLRALVKEA
jgi:hypothetical protein